MHGYRPYEPFVFHLYFSEEIACDDTWENKQHKYKVELKSFYIIKDVYHSKDHCGDHPYHFVIARQEPAHNFLPAAGYEFPEEYERQDKKHDQKPIFDHPVHIFRNKYQDKYKQPDAKEENEFVA